MNIMAKNCVEKIRCYGCGALVDNIEGKPHKYIGATQGCWNLYCEILTKEYSEYSYFKTTHRLTVDTYSIQHPSEPNKQSIQSVNLHLIGLYFVLIRKLTGKEASKKMGEVLAKKPMFEWLEPPVPNGEKTVIDVLKSNNLKEHEQNVKKWAENVWNCWYKKHKETIENLISDNFNKKNDE
jgi:hypothetical protein